MNSFAQFWISVKATDRARHKYEWVGDYGFQHDTRLPMPVIGDSLVLSDKGQVATVRIVDRLFYMGSRDQVCTLVVDLPEGEKAFPESDADKL